MKYVWVVQHGFDREGGDIEEVMKSDDFDGYVFPRFCKRIEEGGNVRYEGPQSIERRFGDDRFFDGGWEWYSLSRWSVSSPEEW
jgi:hypothetical protein